MKVISKYLILVLIVVSVYMFFNYTQVIGSYPIKTISFKGDFIYANENKIRKQLRSLIGQDLIKIDILKIKDNVKENDWVSNVIVERRLPDTLFIEIFEYRPIIIWNKNYYIDDKGKKFRVKQNIVLDLPKIRSNILNYKTMYNLYINLSEMLNEIDLKIISISHENDMLDIHTDRYNFLVRYSLYSQKIDEFIHVFEQFQNKNKKNIQTIDLRYPTGFAVH
ncbi:MAG: FtsQ-type POTRA domain-containing protein [Pseudomonadota bacterium]|nr:FtsQ-type POTRA domain-containing protein [Pseudomonadota bacterium]